MKKKKDNKPSKTGKSKKSNSILNYFKSVKKMYLNSDSFFKDVEDKSLIEVLRFFAIFYLIFFAISIIISLIGAKLGIHTGIINFKLILGNFIGFVSISAITVFLIPAFIYLILKLLRVKKGYISSFKPLAYGFVLIKGYLIIMLIVSFILQLIFPIDLSLLSSMQTTQDPEIARTMLREFFSQTNSIITITLHLIIYLAAIIHGLIFIVKGLSKFNKISKGKSVISIILASIVLLVTLILIGFLNIYLSSGQTIA